MTLLSQAESRVLFLMFSGSFCGAESLQQAAIARLVTAQSEDTCFMGGQVVPEGAQDGFGKQ